ncbi:hypothetical protein GMOD_00007120 [Pyrenophora seminiperda CCB06]|uniref:Uncharacterized protein n=1 Tax=Pyrenophora seminiperda CCB06 TaxID=1302712 RepID=A0A3M7MC68_9PLEO|nr:hypothetical protein GMOD_00007120 [Pyrenophora seminiperda CCB06]
MSPVKSFTMMNLTSSAFVCHGRVRGKITTSFTPPSDFLARVVVSAFAQWPAPVARTIQSLVIEVCGETGRWIHIPVMGSMLAWKAITAGSFTQFGCVGVVGHLEVRVVAKYRLEAPYDQPDTMAIPVDITVHYTHEEMACIVDILKELEINHSMAVICFIFSGSTEVVDDYHYLNDGRKVENNIKATATRELDRESLVLHAKNIFWSRTCIPSVVEAEAAVRSCIHNMDNMNGIFPQFLTFIMGYTDDERMFEYVAQHATLICQILREGSAYNYSEGEDIVPAPKAVAANIRSLTRLPPPDLSSPDRSTNDYFLVWAHSSDGEEEVKQWCAFHESVYTNVEAPPLLQALLTRGAPLRHEWAVNKGRNLDLHQSIVLAYIRRTDEDIDTTVLQARLVRRMYQDCRLSGTALGDLRSVLRHGVTMKALVEQLVAEMSDPWVAWW